VPQVTSVVVSPSSATTIIGQSQTFSAQVSGTGNFSAAVNWLVNDVPGGNATLGTISSAGVYTAPAAVPSVNFLTIHAASVSNPAISGAAQETVVSGITFITINPLNLSMPQGQTQQYQAVVGGVANQSVIWSLPPASVLGFDPGTIAPTGLYTAPNNLTNSIFVSVTATSVLDPRATTSAGVQVFPPPSITQITPSTANAGDTVTLQGTNLDFISDVKFTGPNNISIDAGSGVQVVVPLSAVSGPVTITQQLPGFPPSFTQSLPFTRLPRLRIRAASVELSSGESTQFQLRVLGQPDPQNITWSADVGSIDANGLYTAPGAVGADSFANITACVSGTQICDTEMLALHPFRIDPAQPVVALGGTVQLNAISGAAPVDATFSQLNGGGSITATGLYTASTVATNAGSASILANFGLNSQASSIAVSGGFPGLLARLSDYRNFVNVQPFGTVPTSIAIAGNRAFVSATSVPPSFLRTRFWIDVYDVTDPIHPLWLDAVESACDGDLFTDGTFLYQIAASDDSTGLGPTHSVMAVFNITGPHPVLLDRRFVPDIFVPSSVSNGIAYALPAFGNPALIGTLYQFDMSGGVVTERDLQLAVNGTPVSVTGAVSVQTRLFASFTQQNATQPELGVFDLSADPPAFLGSIPANNSGPATVVSTATTTGNILLLGSEIYDISGPQPVHLASVPRLILRESNGTLALADTFQGGSRIVDISNPSQPAVVQVMGEEGWTSAGKRAAWAGNTLLFADGPGGLAIYDAALPGGPVERALLPGLIPGAAGSAALDQVATASSLFVATSTSIGGALNVYDLTSTPAARIATVTTGTETPVALNLSGSTLFVGTDMSLRVFDATSPTALVQLSSLALGSLTALAHSGSTLYVGTLDKHLLVFDASQPAAPVQQLSILLPGVPDKILVSGNLLLVADDLAGLLIYDVVTPATPVLLTKFATSGAVADISVDGNLALMAAADAGLLIVDISSPSAPILISQTSLTMPTSFGERLQNNLAASIAINNSIAYLGTVSDNDTLFAFDYRQPAHPRLVSLASYVFSVSGGVGLDGALLTLLVSGSDLFIGGALELDTPVVQTDIAQPRNAINFYLPPSSLLPLASPVGSTAASMAVPKSASAARWRVNAIKRIRR
jgi:hypothetical protein